AFIPLLYRQVEIKRLVFKKPSVRVLRDRDGRLNVSTLGKKEGAATPTPEQPAAKPGMRSPMQEQPAAKGGGIRTLTITSFMIEGGTIFYQEMGERGAPVQLSGVDLDVENFNPTNPFDLDLKLSAFGNQQNLKI